MSDTEASALSGQTEDAPARRRRQKKAPRPSFLHFGIRYSQWGGEYKSYCHRCDYESGYGTRGKAVKAAISHVSDVHGVDGGELRP